MRISDVLQAKGPDVVTVSPDTTVRDLVALLADKNIGAVLVSTAETPVAGIVSERDVVRGLAGGVDVLDRPVRRHHDRERRDRRAGAVGPRAGQADDPAAHPPRSRRRRRCRCAGIVSIGDVVKSRIDELEFERDQLESYVSGPG